MFCILLTTCPCFCWTSLVFLCFHCSWSSSFASKAGSHGDVQQSSAKVPVVEVFTPELFAELIQQMKAGNDWMTFHWSDGRFKSDYKWVYISIEALKKILVRASIDHHWIWWARTLRNDNPFCNGIQQYWYRYNWDISRKFGLHLPKVHRLAGTRCFFPQALEWQGLDSVEEQGTQKDPVDGGRITKYRVIDQLWIYHLMDKFILRASRMYTT